MRDGKLVPGKRQCLLAGKVTVGLAMHNKFGGISTYALHGLPEGDEHPGYSLYTPTRSMALFTMLRCSIYRCPLPGWLLSRPHKIPQLFRDFPVGIATLFLMYISTTISPIQLVVSYHHLCFSTLLCQIGCNEKLQKYQKKIFYFSSSYQQHLLKLHFIIQCVCPFVGLQKLIMVSPEFSLTTLQFPDFSRLSRRLVTLSSLLTSVAVAVSTACSQLLHES